MAVLSGVEFVTAIEDRLRGSRRGSLAAGGAGLRFAFYGRMSTSEFQDVDTSWAWQRAVAEELVEGFGTIVAEYFDEGRSRRWAWPDRPSAAALLAAARRPERGFDAVVMGEYERGFSGDQFQRVATELAAVGVQVWLPEAGGPVHQALMVLLGAQAQREVARARARVLAAMRAQTRVQGRFLGGRPPFGYRLADQGPHPNAEHARWAGGSTGWSRIRRPPHGCDGCSPSAPAAEAWPRLCGSSTIKQCHAPPARMRSETRTAPGSGGLCERWR
jgi:DNA invertase Pin-like site-specific DNA recombinase